MTKIAILSDTHGYLHDGLLSFLDTCDEIWHAGDIGNLQVSEKLSSMKKLVAVHGNIDDARMRLHYPKHQRFMCEGVDVWLTHIGGYPGHYDIGIRNEIQRNPPKLFVCGHSHILKIINDKQLNLLHINPGAAGISGFHTLCTAVRFVIDGSSFKDMEIWEKARNKIALA